MKQIVIIGGGISGLATAWFLKKRYGTKIHLTLIEKKTSPGGWIQTIDSQGFLFEAGPRGFRPHGKGDVTLKLAHALGLENEIIGASSSTKNRYVRLHEQLHRFSLPLLIKQGLLQGLFKDLWKKPPQQDLSISAFFSERFGKAFSRNLIVPLVQGIFGGQADKLSMEACFPLLFKGAQEEGSVVKGMLKQRHKRSSLPPLLSFKSGMQTLPNRLHEKFDGELYFSTQVHSIQEDKTIETSQGRLSADHIICAIPLFELSKICSFATSIAQSLPFLTLTTVHLGYERKVLPLKGFGYLFSQPQETGFLGATFDSDLFEEHNRSHQTRLTFMYRGQENEENLLSQAKQLAKEHLDIEATPHIAFTRTASNAIPQYPVGYARQLAQFCFSGFSFTGNSFAGIGVNDCIAHAEGISQKVHF